ncbi:MAG: hypothetical protein ACLUFN_11265 [Eubacterium sp.]
MNNEKELQFRKAKRITTINCLKNEKYVTPICPTCQAPIFIEYISYCSNCGQKLSWKDYDKIKITFI